MKPDSARSTSVWMATTDVPLFAPLDGDLQVDVCVIGAGIAGLTTAHLLAKQGRSVVVLDDGPMCGGETQRTTAHLSNVIDDHYYEVERIHGKEAARLARKSHSAAIDKIEELIAAEKIECDFSRLDGYLFVDSGQSRHDLQREFEACQEAGFDDIEMLDTLPFSDGAKKFPCIRFPRQGQFHVLKYLTGITRAFLRNNGSVYTGTHVTGITDGATVEIATTGNYKVRAKNVVIATNSPITDWIKIHTKQSAYRSYVIAGKIPKGIVPKALFWDMADPYHYVRTQPFDGQHEMLIVGGEDHRTGQSHDYDERFARLESWARQRFPALGSIEQKWSGQVYETIDGLAFIGRDPAHGPNVFIATGDSGMGMTHGTIAGMLLTDLITDKPNEWSAIYEPSRKPLHALLQYVVENAETALSYLDYLKPAEVKSVDEIATGEGAILSEGGKKVAAYRDEYGELTNLCAVCPHAKAIVNWNSYEKSWDCPAHGSRFKADGTVVDGPANGNLQPAEPAPQHEPLVPTPGASDISPDAPGR